MVLNEVSIYNVGVVIAIDCIEDPEDLVAEQLVVAVDYDCNFLLEALVVDGSHGAFQKVLLLGVPHEVNSVVCVLLLDVGFDGLNLVGGEAVSHVDNDEVAVFLVEEGVEDVLVGVWLLVGVRVDDGADGQFLLVLAQLVLLL
jgi:hypothetical protein